MGAAVEALNVLYKAIEYQYAKALQTENEKVVAYLEGELSGVRKSIEALERII